MAKVRVARVTGAVDGHRFGTACISEAVSGRRSPYIKEKRSLVDI